MVVLIQNPESRVRSLESGVWSLDVLVLLAIGEREHVNLALDETDPS